MPDGQEWMLLPSHMRSESVPTVQIRHLARLRRGTAYRPARWLVKMVAGLCYVSAVALVCFEQFSTWPLNGAEGGPSAFAVRFGCALLLGFAGLLVQCGGAMLVDLFDLLLAQNVPRPPDRSENNVGGAD